MHISRVPTRTTKFTRLCPTGPDLSTPHFCTPPPVGYFNFTNTFQQYFCCCSCYSYTRLARHVNLYWTVNLVCGRCNHSPCSGACHILVFELRRVCWACQTSSKAGQRMCGRCKFNLDDPACVFEWVSPYSMGFHVRHSADMVRDEVVAVRLPDLSHKK